MLILMQPNISLAQQKMQIAKLVLSLKYFKD